MVAIGEDAGVRTRAVLSSMEQPLGRAIGNALELAEALDVLRGEGPADIAALCRHEATTLLTMTGVARSHREAEQRVERAISSGAALQKFAEVIAAQGGDRRQIEDPSLLPQAPVRQMLVAPRSGYIAAIEAESMGVASVHLGAGRVRKGDPIDPAVGLVVQAKIGDALAAGAPLVEIHARSDEQAASIRDALLCCFTWSDAPTAPPPLILAAVAPRRQPAPVPSRRSG
jgi:thymidine phosphorylase